MTAIILIPARLSASRLPGKPLLDIGGLPMIVQVMNRALEADIGPVAIAYDQADEAIGEAVRKAGGNAVPTRSDHPSGSDRIAEALARLDSEGRYQQVMNVQGDLPLIDPGALRACHALLDRGSCDIATLAAPITSTEEAADPHVVKAVIDLPEPDADSGSALYFTRAKAPSGDGPLFHHIGVYGYRRAALERFVTAPPSWLETRERLEQLRAYRLGLRIEAALVDAAPLGVDTAADLAAIRRRTAQGRD